MIGDDERVGALFGGRFQLAGLLGVGGSASVYEAEDLQDCDEHGEPRWVAVKVLHPHLSDDIALRDAFLHEARRVEHVEHPNIAAVLAAGVHTTGGAPLAWIALELVTGESLADRVAARGPMNPAEAAAVLDGVLAALQAVHLAGLVHRDVSPANVLLESGPAGVPARSQDVRLVDFGLAEAAGRDAVGRDILRARGGADVSDSAAPVGVVGNAHYMSPEQAQGKPVRAVGDVYQAGAVLYFALTGQPPFPRTTSRLVLDAHLSAPPPVPSALRPDARSLDRVVTRAMTKVPARRFRSAAEMRAALAEAVGADTRWTLGSPRGSGDGDDAMIGEPVTAAAPMSQTKLLPGGRVGDLAYLDDPPAPVSAINAGESGARSRPGVIRGDPGSTPAGRLEPSAVGAVVAGGVIAGLAVWGALGATAAPSLNTSATATPLPPAASGPVAAETTEPAQHPLASDPAEPSATPAEVLVPSLFGTLADADRTLREAGLALGAVDRVDSAEIADRVLGQHPAAGSAVAPNTGITVTVASGRNVVPQVRGMTLAAARAVIESAGFVVDAALSSASSTAEVVGSQPAAGAVLRVGVTVALTLAAADHAVPEDLPPTVPPTPTASPEEGVRR